MSTTLLNSPESSLVSIVPNTITEYYLTNAYNPTSDDGLDSRGERFESLRNDYNRKTQSPLKSNHWKTKRQWEANIEAAAKAVGLERLANLVLTTPSEATWPEVTGMIKKATPFLKQVFPLGLVRVISYSKKGRIHIHVVGICNSEIASGFDWDAYDLHRRCEKEGGDLGPAAYGPCPTKEMKPNANLRRLKRQLKRGLKNAGFGRLYCAPVRSLKGTKIYLATNYRDGVLRAPKRSRIISYMGLFPRVVLPPSQASLNCKARLSLVLDAMGWTRTTVKDVLGPKWSYPLIRPYGVIDELGVQFDWDHDRWKPEAIRAVACHLLDYILGPQWIPPTTELLTVEEYR